MTPFLYQRSSIMVERPLSVRPAIPGGQMTISEGEVSSVGPARVRPCPPAAVRPRRDATRRRSVSRLQPLRAVGADRGNDTARHAMLAAIGKGVLFRLLDIGARDDRPTGLRIGKDPAFRAEEADLDRALRSVAARGAGARDGGFARILRPSHAPLIAGPRIDDRAPRLQPAYFAQVTQQALGGLAGRSKLVGLFKFLDGLARRIAHRSVERAGVEVEFIEPLADFTKRGSIVKRDLVVRLHDLGRFERGGLLLLQIDSCDVCKDAFRVAIQIGLEQLGIL